MIFNMTTAIQSSGGGGDEIYRSLVNGTISSITDSVATSIRPYTFAR